MHLSRFMQRSGVLLTAPAASKLTPLRQGRPTHLGFAPASREWSARPSSSPSGCAVINHQASSVVHRLVSRTKLLHEDVERSIPMRAQSRLCLAPELGGGRLNAKRAGPKFGVAPKDAELTITKKFAHLVSLQ
eukprot:6203311-Pleurochrysis_carterae.AAC.1